MTKPFYPSAAIRRLGLFSLAALSLLTGCGKLRSLYAPTEPNHSHSVTISWTPASPAVAGYYVYREDPFRGLIRLTAGIVSETQYTDRTVEAGRAYAYYVTSVDVRGMESVPSQKITVTVPATPSAKH